MASFFGRLQKGKDKSTAATIELDLLREQANNAVAAKDFDRAIEIYDHAVAVDSSDAEAFYKRGNALRNLGRYQAAIESYDQAIKLNRDYAFAYCNRGVVQQTLGLRDEALSSYQSAIMSDPADAMAHYNCALLMQECDRWEEALECYDRAISIDPMFADAQYNRSLALLTCGDFERGWLDYEWRWKSAVRLGLGEMRRFEQTLWLGQASLQGKRVLLHSEGGLGDTLQFCRYASLVAGLGATVYFEVQPALLDLLGDLDGVSRLIARGSDLPTFDYHCPLMSLPLACKTDFDSIPPPAKHLRTDTTKMARWQTLRQPQGRPRIGLAWSGNPNNANDRRRSICLADLVSYLPGNFEYFRVQRDVREEDQAALAANSFINSVDEDVQDFMHIASLCKCMDLIISVDTSLAHLCGTLGKKTWILTPLVADWRWLRDRADTPWYPSARLFRQKSPGNWGEVFERVVADLAQEFRVESARK